MSWIKFSLWRYVDNIFCENYVIDVMLIMMSNTHLINMLYILLFCHTVYKIDILGKVLNLRVDILGVDGWMNGWFGFYSPFNIIGHMEPDCQWREMNKIDETPLWA